MRGTAPGGKCFASDRSGQPGSRAAAKTTIRGVTWSICSPWTLWPWAHLESGILFSARRKIGAVLTAHDPLGKVEQQADAWSETPKSVPARPRYFCLQIQRDFPEFNWKEFQQKTKIW